MLEINPFAATLLFISIVLSCFRLCSWCEEHEDYDDEETSEDLECARPRAVVVSNQPRPPSATFQQLRQAQAGPLKSLAQIQNFRSGPNNTNSRAIFLVDLFNSSPSDNNVQFKENAVEMRETPSRSQPEVQSLSSIVEDTSDDYSKSDTKGDQLVDGDNKTDQKRRPSSPSSLSSLQNKNLPVYDEVLQEYV